MLNTLLDKIFVTWNGMVVLPNNTRRLTFHYQPSVLNQIRRTLTVIGRLRIPRPNQAIGPNMPLPLSRHPSKSRLPFTQGPLISGCFGAGSLGRYN